MNEGLTSKQIVVLNNFFSENADAIRKLLVDFSNSSEQLITFSEFSIIALFSTLALMLGVSADKQGNIYKVVDATLMIAMFGVILSSDLSDYWNIIPIAGLSGVFAKDIYDKLPEV